MRATSLLCGGRRAGDAVVCTVYLADDEAERLRDDMMRVKNFTGFSTLFFYLMHVRDKLARGAHAGQGL